MVLVSVLNSASISNRSLKIKNTTRLGGVSLIFLLKILDNARGSGYSKGAFRVTKESEKHSKVPKIWQIYNCGFAVKISLMRCTV